jgi:uncharacterized protein (TIGR00369 family)
MATIFENAQKMITGEVPPPPIGRLIGFQLIAVEPGHATFALDAGQQHHNPMGTLHGGVLCDIADVAMGLAYGTTLEEGETFTTLELKINFLRPVKNARLLADGIVVQRGRTVGMAECSVTDERGRLIARATSTCLTLRGEQARDR